ncbi:hypothetical protein [Maricaulis maris]|uniref:hypothetical protein n=1 Tax=Maricaulis maris TaxID=74318 RepID=UPI003B8DE32F
MFLTPLSEALRRRLTAGATAVAINALIVSGLLFMPRPDTVHPDPDILDVIFVSEMSIEPDPLPEPIPEPETEPEAEPEPVAEPEPELIPEAEPAPPPEPEAAIEDAPDPATQIAAAPSATPPPDADPPAGDRPIPAGGVEAPNILSDTNPFNDTRTALPFPGGNGSTEYAVRSIFCLSTSNANREALACPLSDGSEGLPMLQFASEENIARGQAAMAQMTADQIQALFARNGFPGRDLGGQSTLADPSSRPTSSADQMRDTLPPLVPDPAFGD